MRQFIGDIIPADVVRAMIRFGDYNVNCVIHAVHGRDRRAAIRVKSIPIKQRPMLLRAAYRAQGLVKAAPGSDPIWDYLRNRLPGYRRNSTRRGLPFELRFDDLIAMYKRAAGKCELTGVCFALRGSQRSPLAPSIDRVDNEYGYTTSNTRLVCQIANLAMNEWGERALLDFISQANNCSGNCS